MQGTFKRRRQILIRRVPVFLRGEKGNETRSVKCLLKRGFNPKENCRLNAGKGRAGDLPNDWNRDYIVSERRW